MSGDDIMPFGKYGHKGTPTKLKDVPRTYFEWLMQQEGFAQKNPQLAAWIKEGDNATATPKEVENLTIGNDLLERAPVGFKAWWVAAYGERLRKQGEMHYIPYLRVAVEAWKAALLTTKPPEEF